MVELIAGQADSMITNLGNVVRQVQGGELRLLASGDDLCHLVFPDAPRIGDTVPGF